MKVDAVPQRSNQFDGFERDIHHDENVLADSESQMMDVTVTRMDVKDTLIGTLLGTKLALKVSCAIAMDDRARQSLVAKALLNYLGTGGVVISSFVIPLYLVRPDCDIIPYLSAIALASGITSQMVALCFLLFLHLPTAKRVLSTFDATFFLGNLFVFILAYFDCLRYDPVLCFLIGFTSIPACLFLVFNDALTENNRRLVARIANGSERKLSQGVIGQILQLFYLLTLGALVFFDQVQSLRIRTCTFFELGGRNIGFTNASVCLSAWFTWCIFGLRFHYIFFSKPKACLLLKEDVDRFVPFENRA